LRRNSASASFSREAGIALEPSCACSIFDSALYRSPRLKGLFPQEKATLHDLTMAAWESKMLWNRVRIGSNFPSAITAPAAFSAASKFLD
jgi:hypothetical protein